MADTVQMTKDFGGQIATANVSKDAVDAWQADGWKIAAPVKPAKADKVENDSANPA